MAKLIFNPDEDRPIEVLIDDDDEDAYDLSEIDDDDTEVLVEDGGKLYCVILEGSQVAGAEPNMVYPISFGAPLTTVCEEVDEDDAEPEAAESEAEVTG